jgi:hypothetical protein
MLFIPLRVQEGRIRTETRQLSTGSELKLLWHKTYRFYKRAADEVFRLVNSYTVAATDGALGMQGEHLILAAFARQRFLLIAEGANSYGGKTWESTKHDLDFIFERDGVAYGVEVKNTLGYLLGRLSTGHHLDDIHLRQPAVVVGIGYSARARDGVDELARWIGRRIAGKDRIFWR